MIVIAWVMVAAALIVKVPAPMPVMVVPGGMWAESAPEKMDKTDIPTAQPVVEPTPVSVRLPLVAVAVVCRKPFAGSTPVHGCACTWENDVQRMAKTKATFPRNCFMAVMISACSVWL